MAKHLNTMRTVAGFFRAFLGRRLPFLAHSDRLTDIYNYLPIANLYATSGQPSEAQFQLIKDAGYDTVINLAPTSVLENSVIEEAALLSQLGMNYVHIPVDFKNPTEEDFQSFVESLGNSDKVWVHCAANMRVSAFTYRYRTTVLGDDKAEAAADLSKIWQPMGVWSDFIER